MKSFGRYIISVCCLVFLSNILPAQTGSIKRIAILRFKADDIDIQSVKTSRELLRYEFSKLGRAEIVMESDNLPETESKADTCQEVDCAVEAAVKLGAEQALACKLLVLGQKIIIQYSLIDVNQKKAVLSDRMTSTSIEELDVVMKRIASSIAEHLPVDETAEIGSVIEDESKAPLERSGRTFYGLSFGYFYPTTDGAVNERSFTLDYKIGSELKNYDYGLQIFARNGFGANIFSSYLLARKDVCPYIGGGLGFHWIQEEMQRAYTAPGYGYINSTEMRKGDGFELLLNAGLRVFHTYNFRLAVNFSYSHTFNDFKSNAFTLTIGFLH